MSEPDVTNMIESLVPQGFETTELMPTAGAAEKQFEIQSAIVVARRFPRNEDQAFEKLLRSCRRTAFADAASYSFPRGMKQTDDGKWVKNYIEGPSVDIAREAARVWGNIRYGLEIVRDDERSRQIRGWAWDLETNVKVTAEDDFAKLIQRKGKNGGPTEWVKPDERDLRELTNRRGAICTRNSILQLLPKDLIEEALKVADETLRNEAQQDPDAARRKVILSFSELNVTPVMLEAKLGHPLVEASPAEIAELRKVYKSIRDGNSTWAEYVRPKEPEQPAPNLSDLTDKLKQETTPPPPVVTETAAPWEKPAAPPPSVIDETPLTTAVREADPHNGLTAVPDRVPDPPMTLDQMKERLAKAEYVADVRALKLLWAGPKSGREDQERERIAELCDRRIEEIKGANWAPKGSK